MTDQRNYEVEARDALYAKITETVEAIDVSNGIGANSGAILRDLAEAWAWVYRPNQPH